MVWLLMTFWVSRHVMYIYNIGFMQRDTISLLAAVMEVQMGVADISEAVVVLMMLEQTWVEERAGERMGVNVLRWVTTGGVMYILGKVAWRELWVEESQGIFHIGRGPERASRWDFEYW